MESPFCFLRNPYAGPISPSLSLSPLNPNAVQTPKKELEKIKEKRFYPLILSKLIENNKNK